MNETLLCALAFVAALTAMEGVAWAMHRYVMHGFLWSLHRSHHEHAPKGLEGNDWFGLVFAGLATGLFYIGAQPGMAPLWWAAAGVTTYGLLYAMVHDGLVHRRFPFPDPPRSGYLHRLVQAHRLHHAVKTKEGAVSFGFLLPGDVRRHVATLRDRRLARP